MNLTTREVNLVAAMMAVGNMGIVDEYDDLFEDMVASYKEGYTADELVLVMAAPYIESDEIETTFREEASSWIKTIKQYNWKQIFKIWGNHTERFHYIYNTDPSRQG